MSRLWKPLLVAWGEGLLRDRRAEDRQDGKGPPVNNARRQERKADALPSAFKAKPGGLVRAGAVVGVVKERKELRRWA